MLRRTLLLGAVCWSSCVEYRLGLDQRNDRPVVNLPPQGSGELIGLPAPDVCDEQGPIVSADIAINDNCAVDPSSGLLDAMLEWQILEFANYSEYSQAVMTPLVGQLNDDNSDGQIDFKDVPDIVLITDDNGAAAHENGVLRIVSGNGSGDVRSVFRFNLKTEGSTTQVYPYRYANAAIGDIDQDDTPEIVTIARTVEGPGGGSPGGGQDDLSDTGIGDSGGGGGSIDDPVLPSLGNDTCFLVAYSAQLEVEWLNRDTILPCGGHAPAIADLEGDGRIEVVLGPYIFEGDNGALRAKGSGDVGRFLAYAEMGLHSIVADLDLDGVQEIIAGRALYDPQGQKRCQGTAGNDGFTAAADLDMDGQGEFLVVGNGRVVTFEADCSATAQWTLPGGGSGGSPTIADYDGDGFPEIGIADATTYTVYEADGTIVWSMPILDASSHSTGSVVFDFEGDGFPEVIYGDEMTLWVFDGQNGSVRYQSTLHESRTLHEYPTVADIDGDGSAEIVSVNGGSHYGNNTAGLYVYGSATNSWQGGRQVWNQHAYAITNINDDLSVPSPAASNWPLYNNFRSGDVNPSGTGAAPDAVPVAEICSKECDYGRVVIHARVGNQGPAALRAGLVVAAYAEAADGSLRLLAQAITAEVALEGASSDIVALDIPIDQLKQETVLVVVDAQNAVSECQEDNNSIRFRELTCE